MTNPNRDPAVVETLGQYVTRLESYLAQFEGQGIIFSMDCDVEPTTGTSGVVRTPVVWPLIDAKMFYLVAVPARTSIATHSHDEDVFRLVLEGALTVNGRAVEAGSWFVVRRNVPYSVETADGYRTLAGYGVACVRS